MPDLPKRGDCVRVTRSESEQQSECAISPPVPVGSEGEVLGVRDDGQYRFDVRIPGIEIDWTFTPDDVEILERATTDTARGNTKTCPECGGWGKYRKEPRSSSPMLNCSTCPGTGRVPKESDDYTRGRRDGMRRVVEIAEAIVRCGEWYQLKDAVEKESSGSPCSVCGRPTGGCCTVKA